MIEESDAEALIRQHLGDSPRAAHSRFVGDLMGRMARLFNADEALWRTVGLVHDLDYFETKPTPDRHGVLVCDWLAGRLPADALTAIAAHDHRTGVISDTLLADMLKLADVLAVLDETCGRAITSRLNEDTAFANVRERTAARPFLETMLVDLAGKHSLTLETLARMLAAAPPQ